MEGEYCMNDRVAACPDCEGQVRVRNETLLLTARREAVVSETCVISGSMRVGVGVLRHL